MSKVTDFVIDSEQTGYNLIHHSMHWFAVMRFDEKLDTFFEGKMCPRPKTTYNPKNMEHSGATWDEIQSWPNPERVMPTFAVWLIRHTTPGTVPRFWADNNGHDIKWLNYYLDLYLPFDPKTTQSLTGHSSRNVNDWHKNFVKGRAHADDPVPERYKIRKNLAVTKHNHTPVCDVRAVCESMLAMGDVGLHILPVR
jgi:hypothetical protein